VPGTGIRAWSACSDKERCTETYILLATVDGFCTEGWNFDLNHGNRPLSSSPRRSRRGARSIDMVEIGSRIAPFCTNLSARAVRSQRLLRASMQMETGGAECQVTGKCDETRCLAHRRLSRSFCRMLGGPARAETSVKSFTIVPPHVQVVVEGNQIWRGMRRWQDKDSHPWHHIPILQCKICPPLSELTINVWRRLGWRDASTLA
jgi:hypothetical protein